VQVISYYALRSGRNLSLSAWAGILLLSIVSFTISFNVALGSIELFILHLIGRLVTKADHMA
jgi:hypothetical protein